MFKEIFEWIKTIAIAVIIALVVTTFVTPLMVDGLSMYPTLNDHDYLILKNTHEIQRGDIISFKSTLEFSQQELESFNFIKKLKLGKNKSLIKRVIAIPGDELLIQNGKVYVNGEELKENYINGDTTSGDVQIDKIPKGKIFVMGDNRENSLDSRKLGLVDISKIQGKALVRLLPISNFGQISSQK
ncbi:signal peptidase I [Crassaminicella profunda]|uniref:signal peptidase I n=1 Tax=Crassaminicella profunda TaxID=1286698 RepID=UPI001CA7114D|nr:signal peptidase I [Crassaminicella profunda]QZY55239.1 signal peptidase I [Crassaminicella profunda]